jgi:hypothetical protein
VKANASLYNKMCETYFFLFWKVSLSLNMMSGERKKKLSQLANAEKPFADFFDSG